jgi:hypothetical protein
MKSQMITNIKLCKYNSLTLIKAVIIIDIILINIEFCYKTIFEDNKCQYQLC